MCDLRRAGLIVLWAIAVMLCGAGVRAQPSAAEILASSDAIRNPGNSFALDVQVLEYRRGRESDSAGLTVYSKPGEDGSYRTLVHMVAPARDRDKLFLEDGSSLWFYDPHSKATIRISPQQRLLGQAANGDVVTTNFSNDYEAQLEGEEEVQDGERQMRKCYRLLLRASSPDATYHSIVMWVEQETYRPVKGRFFAPSGELLKTVYYRRFSSQLGADRPTEVVIIDGLDNNWITVMRYSNYRSVEIPESWLQREYLDRFRPY